MCRGNCRAPHRFICPAHRLFLVQRPFHRGRIPSIRDGDAYSSWLATRECESVPEEPWAPPAPIPCKCAAIATVPPCLCSHGRSDPCAPSMGRALGVALDPDVARIRPGCGSDAGAASRIRRGCAGAAETRPTTRRLRRLGTAVFMSSGANDVGARSGSGPRRRLAPPSESRDQRRGSAAAVGGAAPERTPRRRHGTLAPQPMRLRPAPADAVAARARSRGGPRGGRRGTARLPRATPPSSRNRPAPPRVLHSLV